MAFSGQSLFTYRPRTIHARLLRQPAGSLVRDHHTQYRPVTLSVLVLGGRIMLQQLPAMFQLQGGAIQHQYGRLSARIQDLSQPF